MKGEVILVGAGPGGAGLLTLRGKEALERAQVVLYDRLVGPEILAMIPQEAERVDVGKSAGSHPIPQSEINALLLRHAAAGKRVVRLKGGDPYLFGRGAEEIEAIIKEGIPFEIVPGVTSAIAVPAFAGIPVSHRDFASSLHVISAHRKGGARPQIDYASLVKLNGTLVFLMGTEMLEAIAAGLIGSGMAADTPAALVENGTRPNQRKLLAAIADIAPKARDGRFASPCVLVVGGVCSLADRLDWFTKKPLHGVSVAVTRPKGEGGLSKILRGLGAAVVDLPCISTQALPVPEHIFAELSEYRWIIFTSPVGAQLFFDALKARRLDIRKTHGAAFAAVGAKTAAVVEERGVCVEYVPAEYNATALAQGLPLGDSVGDSGSGGGGNGDGGPKALLFRAAGGTAELPEILRERGFCVDDVHAYATLPAATASDAAHIAMRGVRLVAFTSASTVRGFAALLPQFEKRGVTAVCIGEATAAEARRHGFFAITSAAATIDSVAERIVGALPQTPQKG